MKYFFTTLLIISAYCLLAIDTTTIYLDYSYNQIKKKKKATYYEKRVETSDGLWYSELHLMNGTIYGKGSYQTKNAIIQEGSFEEYYLSGSLRETGNYSNGIKVKRWVTYYETGEKESYGIYDQEGEKDSVWVSLHKNGEVDKIGRYTHGKKIGEWLSFFEDGSAYYIWIYNEEGQLHGNYITYGKSSGLPFDTGVYENGDKVGEWKYFFSSGEPSGVVIYDKGEPGSSEYWNEDGGVVNQENQVVNQDPSFPGGVDEMYSFLAKNTKYPVEARDNNIKGRVYISFVVEKNGDITEVKMARSVHPTIDNEGMRVIKEMPTWLPGIDQNRIVRVRFILPIVFDLQ